MRTLINILLGIIGIAIFGNAQTIVNQKDPILGTWKGTSICQVKNSPCHDEVLVCYISKASAPNTYKFVMNKIINNAEEPMGDLNFIYNEAQSSLTCHLPAHNNSLWKLELKKNTMQGTLTVDNNTLYRIIKLAKS